MNSARRLRINPIACDGRGLCAEVLPEMITLDDWGFPIISGGDIPAALRPAAEEAIRLCPRLALRIDRPRAPKPSRSGRPSNPPGAGRRRPLPPPAPPPGHKQSGGEDR
jgi:ferredoxin